MNIAFDLIVLPFHDWKKCELEGFRTRDAHLLLEFEKHPAVRNILVIDRPISISEILLKRRYWRVRGGSVVRQGYLTWLTQVSPKIYVLDIVTHQLIRPLLLRFGWWGYIFRQPSIIKKIRSAIEFLGLKRIVLFIWSPLSTGLVGHLNETLLVFDALDNWLVHPEVTSGKEYIEQGYDVVRRKSHLIFTNSQDLKKFLGGNRDNVFYIPNGVSLDYFTSSDGVEIPGEMEKIPSPRIGYVGKLAKRIDVDLVSFLATSMPHVNFVFIGPILNRQWIRPLFKFKNIHFLGDKSYSRIPAYLLACDVCIIPHNLDTLNYQGNPLKLYEYLAAGKSVVTTNVGGVEVFIDLITIARSPEEFLDGIQKYLVMTSDERRQMAQRLRKSLQQSFTWEYKAKEMIRLISERFVVKANELS